MLKLTQKLDPQVTGPYADELVLTWDQRKLGRLRATTVKEQDVGLFLERGKVLQDGQLLQAESGERVRIVAADEPVVTASCEDPLIFARICYHLGNRHVPLQIGTGWVRFQPDYVLEDLVKLYGLQVIHELAPFSPENGAYGEHGGHGHGSHQHAQETNSHPFVRLAATNPRVHSHD